jgi:ribosome-binding protein aMBF1 (putative translation factor)
MLHSTNVREDAVQEAISFLTATVDGEGTTSEVAGALNSLLSQYRLLDRRSPFRTHALEQVTSLIEPYVAEDEERSLELLPERERVATLLAREEIARRLRDGRDARGVSVRDAAKKATLSASYLSELEGAKTGLPSDEVARKLEHALGISLREVVHDGRETLTQLSSEAESRVRRVAIVRDTDPRVVAAISALRRAPALVEITELAGRLDDRERRALIALMRELT